MNYWIAPDVLGESYSTKINDSKIEEIIKYVSTEHNITIFELTSKSRKRNIVTCRHEISYILHKVYKVNSSKVGSLFNRDHSTVLHSCKTVSNFIEIDKKYEKHMGNLINNFMYYYIELENNKTIKNN
tara:strand:- start:415 stop:798 length:384 start_codon:yes stop_codon:yes gene_type:complete